MKSVLILIMGISLMFSTNTLKAQDNPLIWEYKLTDLKKLNGILTTGNPKVIDSPYGKAILFDGIADSYSFPFNPLKSLTCFTIEVLIRPDLKGPDAQRFLHIGEVDGDRMLIETRITEGNKWYLDTYIQSGNSQKTLVDKKLVHSLGSWYHVALTLDKNGEMTNYINGKMEIKGSVDFKQINSGEMSIGVRRNKVSWYKGAIYLIKISPEVIKPENFISY